MALGPRQAKDSPKHPTRIVSAVGSAANFAVALLILGFSYGVDPQVRLLQQPWITIEHLLRSAVWLQVVIGVVNLLPSSALSTRRLVRAQQPAPEHTAPPPIPSQPSTAFGFSTAIALAFMVSGIIFGLLWPVLLGLTLLLSSYLNRAARAGSVEGLSMSVRDIMLTEYKPLNASVTLRDALRQTAHTTQDLFPVLRGERLVGWTSRSALASRLRTEGDGFLQGVMSRSFQAVAPQEKLGEALRRATALGAGEFVPVIEEGAMVGMLTPISVERAASQLRSLQVQPERDAL